MLVVFWEDVFYSFYGPNQIVHCFLCMFRSVSLRAGSWQCWGNWSNEPDPDVRYIRKMFLTTPVNFSHWVTCSSHYVSKQNGYMYPILVKMYPILVNEKLHFLQQFFWVNINLIWLHNYLFWLHTRSDLMIHSMCNSIGVLFFFYIEELVLMNMRKS